MGQGLAPDKAAGGAVSPTDATVVLRGTAAQLPVTADLLHTSDRMKKIKNKTSILQSIFLTNFLKVQF